jgi:hypothetical protein
MSRWFRFYADAMRNPKVMRLSDKDFRLWVRLLAVASENDGHIAPAGDLRMVLAMRQDYLEGGLKRLLNGGLIDPLTTGYEPHGWSKYQYKSDVSTDRVQRFRAKRNVSETPPDTDTEVTVAKATDAAGASSFWNFAVAYLGEGRRSSASGERTTGRPKSPMRSRRHSSPTRSSPSPTSNAPFAGRRPRPGKSGDMAAHQTRQVHLPPVWAHAPQQARQEPQRQPGRNNLALELPQRLRIFGRVE